MQKQLRSMTLLVFVGLFTLSSSLKADGFRPFFESVGKKTRKSESEIRDKAVFTLMLSGKYSREDLVRIGKGDGVFEKSFLNETVKLLQEDAYFREDTGLNLLIRSKVAQKAAREFMKFASSSPTRALEIIALKIDAAELHLLMHPERQKELNEKVLTLKESYLEAGRLFLATNNIPHRELMAGPDGRTVLEIRFEDLSATAQEHLKNDWDGKFRHFWIDAEHRGKKPLLRKIERVVVLDINTMRRITPRTR